MINVARTDNPGNAITYRIMAEVGFFKRRNRIPGRAFILVAGILIFQPSLNTKNDLSAAMKRKRYESPIFTVGLFVLIFLGIVATAWDPTGLAASSGGVIKTESLSVINYVLLAIGLVMVVAGVVIRFVAIATLKRNFSGALRIRTDHTLVKNGIYEWVRHPAYLGAILLFTGFPVMLSSLLGVLVMLLLVPYLLHRIKLEESMMIERFGKEYEDYMRSSKRLVPFVY